MSTVDRHANKKPARPPERPIEALPAETLAMLREVFSPEPPADLLDRARAYLREVRVTEGKLGPKEWAAKLDEATERLRSTVPPQRRETAFSNYRSAHKVGSSAAIQAAHATALTIYAQEREAGRYTTLQQCIEVAFTACRIPKEARRP